MDQPFPPTLALLALSFLGPSAARAAPEAGAAIVRPAGTVLPVQPVGNGNGNVGSNNGNSNQTNGNGNFGTGNGHGNGGRRAPRA
ncbi:hypothetical protein ACRAWG_08450 [Methylobacterium sp. P31]